MPGADYLHADTQRDTSQVESFKGRQAKCCHDEREVGATHVHEMVFGRSYCDKDRHRKARYHGYRSLKPNYIYGMY